MIRPQITLIFTDFIYPNIRVHLCYLWEIPSHDDGSSYSFIDSEMRPLR